MAIVLLPDQTSATGVLARVSAVVARELRPHVRDIDAGTYPADVLRELGAVGAFSQHIAAGGSEADLKAAIEAMAIVGEECLATAFCTWCQDALGWYIANTENTELRQRLLSLVTGGEILGGTGLSNPMKALSGIEALRLRGVRVGGGWRVNGMLPWVSNLGDGHLFGICFAGDGDRLVMALARCGNDGVTTRQNAHFIALEGTATLSVQFRDAFIPDSMVLADPAEPFVRRIRAGFILLQTGMALGLVRGAIASIRESDRVCGEANTHLQDRPDDLYRDAARLTDEINALARTPYETNPGYLRAVLQVRLRGSELALAAAQSAMLHAGARGYIAGSPASRKLREAYFVAIVTPATKHLRNDIASLDAIDDR